MRETTTVVSEIGRQIASVDEGSTVIAAAMEEQSATILEIARHVSETAKAAEYVSDSVAVVLAEALGCACRVEVPEGDVLDSMDDIVPAKHLFKDQLGFAVWIDRFLG